MSDFKLLLEKVRKCQLCVQQLPLTPRPILQASSASKILIAGQAPGIITHEKGIPFDDKSGQRLRLWLGVDNNQFYDEQQFAIVPMGFCYPGKGKSGDLPPIPLCAQTWRNELMETLKEVELTILVGKYAIDWHLNRLNLKQTQIKETTECLQAPYAYKNITELVKQWQALLLKNIIAIPHPSPRNNIWLKKNPWFEQEVIPVLQQRVLSLLTPLYKDTLT